MQKLFFCEIFGCISQTLISWSLHLDGKPTASHAFTLLSIFNRYGLTDSLKNFANTIPSCCEIWTWASSYHCIAMGLIIPILVVKSGSWIWQGIKYWSWKKENVQGLTATCRQSSLCKFQVCGDRSYELGIFMDLGNINFAEKHLLTFFSPKTPIVSHSQYWTLVSGLVPLSHFMHFFALINFRFLGLGHLHPPLESYFLKTDDDAMVIMQWWWCTVNDAQTMRHWWWMMMRWWLWLDGDGGSKAVQRISKDSSNLVAPDFS